MEIIQGIAVVKGKVWVKKKWPFPAGTLQVEYFTMQCS